MSSCYCLYCLGCSEQTMLLKKMMASLAPPLYCNSRTEMSCAFPCLLVGSIRPALLGFSSVCLTACSSGWAEAGGWLQNWEFCGRLLALLGFALATWICWTEARFLLGAKEPEAVRALTCDGLAGLHLLSHCNFFILKVWLCSQYNENGVSEWIFAHENQ